MLEKNPLKKIRRSLLLKVIHKMFGLFKNNEKEIRVNGIKGYLNLWCRSNKGGTFIPLFEKHGVFRVEKNGKTDTNGKKSKSLNVIINIDKLSALEGYINKSLENDFETL